MACFGGRHQMLLIAAETGVLGGVVVALLAGANINALGEYGNSALVLS